MSKPRQSSAPTAKQLAENSRVQMAQVVEGLITGQSVRSISEATGISPSRINRWIDDPEFREMFESIESNLLDAIERRLVDNVSDAVERLGPKAVRKLEDALDSEKEAVALSAAKTVLQMGGFGKPKPAAQVIPIEAKIRTVKDVSPAAGD